MASVGSGDSSQVSINIMPMLDIFSILILFLLMSFSTDPVNHDLLDRLELPDSATLRSLDEIPIIRMNKNDLYVNDRKVTSFVNGDVPEAVRSQGAILPLFRELDKLAEANRQITQKKKNEMGKLTIECDRSHSYKLLKRVMLSAQQADFITFKYMAAKLQH